MQAKGCTTCKGSLVDVLLLASAEQKPGARPIFEILLLVSAEQLVWAGLSGGYAAAGIC